MSSTSVPANQETRTASTQEAGVPFADHITEERSSAILDKAHWHNLVTEEVAKIQRGDENAAADLSVIFVDINNFKSVNDVHGHLEGDQVIEDFEGLLGNIAGSFRNVPNNRRPNSDVLAYDQKKGVEAGKFGGDEFAALCYTDEEGASLIVKRIIGLFDDYLSQEDKKHLRDLGIGISIGVSTLKPGMSDSDLLKEADQEMYADKEAQRPQLNDEQENAVSKAEQILGEVSLSVADVHKYRRKSL